MRNQEGRRRQKYPKIDKHTSPNDRRLIVVVAPRQTLELFGLSVLLDVARRRDAGAPAAVDPQLRELAHFLIEPADPPAVKRDEEAIERIAQALPPAAA